MSRANIIDMHPSGSSLLVTFQCKDGTTPTYLYRGADAEEIMAGADPAHYAGEQVGSSGGGGGIGIGGGAGGDLGDALLEGAEDIALLE